MGLPYMSGRKILENKKFLEPGYEYNQMSYFDQDFLRLFELKSDLINIKSSDREQILKTLQKDIQVLAENKLFGYSLNLKIE